MTVEPEHADIYRSNIIDDITVTPFIKRNWKTGSARDYWAPKLNHFKFIKLKSLPHIIEDDDHPTDALLLSLDENSLEIITESTLDNTNIKLENIDNKNSPHKLFTNYINIITNGVYDEQNNYQIIAKTESLAAEFEKLLFDTIQSDKYYTKIASKIGMPKCCIEEHKKAYHHKETDTIYRTGCNTPSAEMNANSNQNITIKNPDPYLNTFWRHFGIQLIFHQPCSFECKESGEIGRKTFTIMRDIEKETDKKEIEDLPISKIQKELEFNTDTSIEDILYWMDQPLTWEGYHALTNIRSAYAIGSYKTNNHWDKKTVTWKKEHVDKPDFEINHPTGEYEILDPSAGAL